MKDKLTFYAVRPETGASEYITDQKEQIAEDLGIYLGEGSGSFHVRTVRMTREDFEALPEDQGP